MHGLRVWGEDGVLRLDPGDKQIMHYAYFEGGLQENNSVTITVGGGYNITNGDWGIDITPVNRHLKAISSSNRITLTLDDGYGSGTLRYRVNVFKLNQRESYLAARAASI